LYQAITASRIGGCNAIHFYSGFILVKYIIPHCYYRTVEECVPNVLAGNRGSCNLNPYFTASRGPAATARPAHRKRG